MDESFYKALLDNLADGVYFIDTNRRITFWNKAAERLTGYTAQEVVGKSCADNVLRHVDESGKELCVEGCPLAGVLQDGRMREAHVYMHHKLGFRAPVDIRATALRKSDGEIVGAVEIFHTPSERLNILEEIQKLRKEVLTDPLTGVGNRRYAEMRLQECEKDEREYGVPYGILFVDIDHFKRVNDTWGHGVGDRVLRMVAQVLDKSVRSLDTPCRWGGEEFVVITRNVTAEGLQTLGERLRVLIEKSWLDHQGERIAVTASFGGALSRTGETAEDVMSRADKQLYRSKAEGRNRVRLDT
ncbi:MAG: diguanylate cyclase [Desulfosoma sp.]